MLKRILFLLSFLFCLSFSTAQAEDWIFMARQGMGPQPSLVYIDADRIEADEDTATVWSKEVYPNGGYEIMKHRFHRKSRTYDDLYRVVYNADGEKVEEYTLDAKNNPIYPGHTSIKVYNFIWRS